MSITVIYVKAANDVHAHPRRGWIITHGTESPSEFVDEGYMGRDALYSHFGLPKSDRSLAEERFRLDMDMCEVHLDITVSQYNKLKRGEA